MLLVLDNVGEVDSPSLGFLDWFKPDMTGSVGLDVMFVSSVVVESEEVILVRRRCCMRSIIDSPFLCKLTELDLKIYVNVFTE